MPVAQLLHGAAARALHWLYSKEAAIEVEGDVDGSKPLYQSPYTRITGFDDRCGAIADLEFAEDIADAVAYCFRATQLRQMQQPPPDV